MEFIAIIRIGSSYFEAVLVLGRRRSRSHLLLLRGFVLYLLVFGLVAAAAAPHHLILVEHDAPGRVRLNRLI